MIENKYNLLDENWIPVVGAGKVGLKRIFSDSSLTALGGNPIEKIAVFKLLLAIAQTACTPKDEDEWKLLGRSGMQEKVLEYLDSHRDCFWLYGEKPFLQMPEIRKAKTQPYGALKMEVAVGNTTVVTQLQKESPLDDSEKALLLIVQMNFAFGGKKVDNSVILTDGYKLKFNEKGNEGSGKCGPSLVGNGVYGGALHSFFLLPILLDSIYINWFSIEKLDDMNIFPNGLGIAPWEDMPHGEDDSVAKKLKQSYMGRLVAMCRFIYFCDDNLHYSEGILHPDYKKLSWDPSMAVNTSGKNNTMLFVNPEKRPWRELTSLLTFLCDKRNSFQCYQLKAVENRLKYFDCFSIWSGGLRVTGTSGEFSPRNNDDFVESEVKFDGYFSDGRVFYSSLTGFMENLEKMNKLLYGKVSMYYNDLKAEGKEFAAKSTNIFWQLCEGEFQNVIDICSGDNAEENLKPVLKKIRSFVSQIYDETCPKDTARQMEAWAKNKPFMKKSKIEEER